MQLPNKLGTTRRWGDREFVWGMLALTALLVWAANVFAPDPPKGPRHREAATVVAERESGSNNMERITPPVEDRVAED